jgi:2-keto-3-deoxy-L-rhamnonate aldolase RhmA
MTHTALSLFLFTADLATARRAERAGIDNVIVDWEQHDKHSRQEGQNTEINDHSPDDVLRLSSQLRIPVTVRINPLHGGTAAEIQCALDHGATTLMLPMASTPKEVDAFLRLVAERAKTLVQVETQSLARQSDALASLPWDYVHVGLNDLKISRRDRWLWSPLVDGTVERICRALPDRAVGFGGGTILGGGVPIPFMSLFQEMARLNARVLFLRRSFLQEVVGRDWTREIHALRAAWAALQQRDPAAIQRDHSTLIRLLNGLAPSLHDSSFSSPSFCPFPSAVAP